MVCVWDKWDSGTVGQDKGCLFWSFLSVEFWREVGSRFAVLFASMWFSGGAMTGAVGEQDDPARQVEIGKERNITNSWMVHCTRFLPALRIYMDR